VIFSEWEMMGNNLSTLMTPIIELIFWSMYSLDLFKNLLNFITFSEFLYVSITKVQFGRLGFVRRMKLKWILLS
jgi:hypothetical protein